MHSIRVPAGSFGTVYEMSLKNCGPVAVKHFDREDGRDSGDAMRNLKREFCVMSRLLHAPNIVRLEGVCTEPGSEQ